MQFCCLSEDSKTLLSDLIEKHKDELAASFDSSRASIASNYIWCVVATDIVISNK